MYKDRVKQPDSIDAMLKRFGEKLPLFSKANQSDQLKDVNKRSEFYQVMTKIEKSCIEFLYRKLTKESSSTVKREDFSHYIEMALHPDDITDFRNLEHSAKFSFNLFSYLATLDKEHLELQVECLPKMFYPIEPSQQSAVLNELNSIDKILQGPDTTHRDSDLYRIYFKLINSMRLSKVDNSFGVIKEVLSKLSQYNKAQSTSSLFGRLTKHFLQSYFSVLTDTNLSEKYSDESRRGECIKLFEVLIKLYQNGLITESKMVSIINPILDKFCPSEKEKFAVLMQLDSKNTEHVPIFEFLSAKLNKLSWFEAQDQNELKAYIEYCAGFGVSKAAVMKNICIAAQYPKCLIEFIEIHDDMHFFTEIVNELISSKAVDIKSKLLDKVLKALDIAADPQKLFQKEKTDLEKLKYYKFYFQYANTDEMDFQQVEEWANCQRYSLETEGMSQSKQESHELLSQIDEWINAKLIEKISQRVSQTADAKRSEIVKNYVSEEDTLKYSSFYLTDEDTNPQLMERKKTFVRLLLQQLRIRKVNIDKCDEVSQLIDEYNQSGLIYVKDSIETALTYIQSLNYIDNFGVVNCVKALSKCCQDNHVELFQVELVKAISSIHTMIIDLSTSHEHVFDENDAKVFDKAVELTNLLLTNILITSSDQQSELYPKVQALRKILDTYSFDRSLSDKIDEFQTITAASLYKLSFYLDISTLLVDVNKRNSEANKKLNLIEKVNLSDYVILGQALVLLSYPSKNEQKQTKCQLIEQLIQQFSSGTVDQAEETIKNHLKASANLDEKNLVTLLTATPPDYYTLLYKLIFEENSLDDLLKIAEVFHDTSLYVVKSPYLAKIRQYIVDKLLAATATELEEKHPEYLYKLSNMQILNTENTKNIFVWLTYLIKVATERETYENAVKCIASSESEDKNDTMVSFDDLLHDYLIDNKETRLLIKVYQHLVLLEFNQNPKETLSRYIKVLKDKLDMPINSEEKELKKLYMNLIGRFCKFSFHQYFNCLDPNLFRLSTLVQNICKNEEYIGENFESIAQFLMLLAESTFNGDKEKVDTKNILLKKDPKIVACVIKNVFDETEQVYAQDLDNDALKYIIETAKPYEYLSSLKWYFWRDRVVDKLLSKHKAQILEECSKLPQNIGIKNAFNKFIYADNRVSLRRALDDLKNYLITDDTSKQLQLMHDVLVQLIMSNAISHTEGTESTWVDLVEKLTQYHPQLDLVSIKLIIMLSSWFSDSKEVSFILKNNSTDMLMGHYFYQLFKSLLQSDAKLSSLLLSPELATANGIKVLYLLATQLKNSSDSIDVKEFNNLVQLVVQAKIHRDSSLITKLAQLPLKNWRPMLKRIILADKLRINSSDILIDDLLTIRKTFGEDIYEQLVRYCEEKKLSMSEDLSEFRKICEGLASNELHIDESLLNELVKDDIKEWKKKLVQGNKDGSDENLTLEELVAELIADEKVNPTELSELLKNQKPQSEKPLTLLESIINESRDKYEKNYKGLSESDFKENIFKDLANLKANTSKFLMENHKISPDMLSSYFAILLKAVNCVNKQELRNTQLIALIGYIYGFESSSTGRLANISTGEGKSLIATAFAITCVLHDERVDVCTSSSALAVPQAEKAKPLCNFFGINVANNCDTECENDEILRRKRYDENKIIYGDAGSFQRDILLDEYFDKNLRNKKSNRLIVDEVDSPFIDNTDKVLYLSHGIADLSALRFVLEFIWSCVHGKGTESQSERNTQLIIELYHQQVANGVLNIPPFLSEFVSRRLPLWINSAYIAKNMTVDTAYSVMTEGAHCNKPVINDLPTGVEQFQSQWSNGLHQFIQLKHRKEITDETLRAVFISNLSYFKRYHDTGRLNGMSGTLGGRVEREFMANTYKTKSFYVPRFRKSRLRKERGIVKSNIEEWCEAIKKDTLEKISMNVRSEISHEEAEQKYSSADKALKEMKGEIESLEKKLSEINAKIVESKKRIEFLNDENKNLSFVSEVTQEEKKKSRDQNALEIENLNTAIISYETEATKIQEKINIKSSEYKAQKEETENFKSIKEGKTGRAVLIICEDKKLAKSLSEMFTEHFKTQKAPPHKLYSYISNTDEFHLETERVQPGDIIIATNIAGRGTDLEISESLSHNGGLHVVLTNIPGNKRIEDQAKGRGARNGHPGSCKFIVCDSRHTNENPISVDLLLDIRDELENNRLKQIEHVKLPRLNAEEELLEQFSNLQKEVIEYLRSHHFDDGYISVQIKSLQDRWAFWLDEHDKMLNEVHETGLDSIRNEFNTFRATLLNSLKYDTNKLIFEPAEWFRLAQHYAYTRNFSAAFDCYHKAIENNKEFSGFYHYYLAQAYILASKTDYKSEARKHLKLAEKQFQKQIQRLSTSSQILEFMKQYDISSGVGVSADLLTKTNNDEIGIYNTHIQACREAMGSILTPDLFHHAEFGNTPQEQVFADVKKGLPDSIKDMRVSKKAKIVKDPDSSWSELYYKDDQVRIPSDYNYCRTQIIECLSQYLLKDSSKAHQQRKIDTKKLEEYILTKSQFMSYLGNAFSSKNIIVFSDSISKDVKGSEIFKDYSDTVQKLLKEILMTQKSGMDYQEFRQILNDKLKDSPVDLEKLIQYLQDRKLVKVESVTVFSDDTKKVLHDYTHEILFEDHLTEADIDKIPFEKYPGLCHFSVGIKGVLRNAIDKKPKSVKISDFNDLFKDKAEDLFRALFYTLRDNELSKNNLLQIIKHTIPDEKKFQYDLIEYQLLLCHEKAGVVNPEVLSLPKEASHSIDMLTRNLADQGFVKMPSVYFPCKETSNSAVINQTLSKVRYELMLRLNSKINDKKIDAICEVIEKSLGTLRTLPKVELKNFNLEEYFRGMKLPPVAVKHMLAQLGDVFHLIEAVDKKNTGWDAFLCAMLGVVQIVVGAIITYCCPAAAYFGQMLINEGIGDIIFAITSSINDNFSWEAYGDHKAQSVALSILTMGVEIALTSGKAVTQAAEAAKEANKSINIAKRIGAELLKAAVQIAAGVSVNLIMANLGQEVIEAVVKDFKNNFKNKCKEKVKKNGLIDSLQTLYTKLGTREADVVINAVLKDLNLDQRCNALISKDAHKAAENIAHSIAKVKLKNTSSSSNNVASSLITAQDVINVASVVSDILHATSYINSISDVIKSTEKLFTQAQQALKEKADNVLQKSSQKPMNEADLQSCASDKANQLIEVILNKVEQKVVSILQRGGSEMLSLAINPMVESAQQSIEKGVQSLATKNHALLEEAQVITMAAKPVDKKESSHAPEPLSETFTYEDLKAAGVEIVVTDQGTRLLSEVDPAEYADKVFVKDKDDILMLPDSFSGFKIKFKVEKKLDKPPVDTSKLSNKLSDARANQKKLSKKLDRLRKGQEADQKNLEGMKVDKAKVHKALKQHEANINNSRAKRNNNKQSKAQVNKAIAQRGDEINRTNKALNKAKKKVAGMMSDAKKAAQNKVADISKTLAVEKVWGVGIDNQIIPATTVFNNSDLGKLEVGLGVALSAEFAAQASIDHKKSMKLQGSAGLKSKAKYASYESPEGKFIASLQSSINTQVKVSSGGKKELVVDVKALDFSFNPFTDGFNFGPYNCTVEVSTGLGFSYDPKSMLNVLKGPGPQITKFFQLAKASKMGFFIDANHNCTLDKSKLKQPTKQEAMYLPQPWAK